MDGYLHHLPWKSQSEIMYRSKSFLFKYDVDSLVSSSQRMSNYRGNGVFMADVDDRDDEEEEEAGLSVSVPFTWESQPGTPKVMWLIRDGDQPPLLTPPPYCTPARVPPPPAVGRTKMSNPRKKGFFRYIFPRFRRSREKDHNDNSLESSATSSFSFSS